MTTKHIGFLHLEESESKESYVGGILVTDMSSVPVEFRVTLPVKPNAIQRSLYGDALAPYVGVELCGKPLLKAVDHRMELVFAAPGFMLGVRSDCACPVVHVQKTGELIEVVSSREGVIGDGDQHRLDIPPGRFQPLTLLSAAGFADDLNVVRPVIQEVAATFYLLEPFDRIKRALTILADKDPKFSQ